VSELSPETRALLEAGRHRPGLTPVHRDRLRAEILVRTAGAAVVTTATSAAALTSLAAKVIGGVVLVAATGAAVASGTGAWPRRAQPQAPQVVLAAPRAATTAPTERVVTAAPSPAPSAQPAVSPVVVARTEPPPRASARPQEAPAPPVAADDAVVPERVAEGASDRASQPASLPDEPRLEQEVRLLREADRAVKGGEPDRALLLLDQHAAAFPHSTLEPERSAERVFALCRAGRVAQARADAATFLALHPAGPLAVRVRGTCAETGR
jgi:hypothetical protein